HHLRHLQPGRMAVALHGHARADLHPGAAARPGIEGPRLRRDPAAHRHPRRDERPGHLPAQPVPASLVTRPSRAPEGTTTTMTDTERTTITTTADADRHRAVRLDVAGQTEHEHTAANAVMAVQNLHVYYGDFLAVR